MAPSVPGSSVIVTCYNQERFIRQALDSVAAQTVAPITTVVIDGFSSDRSVEVIERWIEENPHFPIVFIRHERNHGLCATLNQGMAEVRSEFVLTLYGDDWLEPDRIERQSAVLRDAPADVCLVVGSMREVDRRGMPLVDHEYASRIEPLTLMGPDERLASLIAENVIPSPAVLVRADRVREVGGYDEDLTFDDYDMWLRLLGQWGFRFQHDIVVNYRFLDDSLSRSADRHGDFLLSEARMVHKYAGRSDDLDAIIAARLRPTVEALRAAGDARRLHAVGELLRDVEPVPR